MVKKIWPYCAGCLIIGASVGYFCGLAGSYRGARNVNAACNIDAVVTAQRKANDAYLHESRPVAVYALQEAQHQMELCEEHPEFYTIVGEPFFTSTQQFAFYMMMTHARLAEIYAEMGQTNLSQQHVEGMLKYANEGTRYPFITNDAALIEFLNKHGKGVK